MSSPASDALRLSFIALTLATAALLPLAVAHAARGAGLPQRRRLALTATAAAGVSAYLAVTYALARSGAFAFGPLPPRLMVAVLVAFAGTVLLVRSRLGTLLARNLPWAALCGFQVFRVPVELALWRAHHEGLLPAHMTFEGWNFDVASGLLGGALGIVARTRPVPRWALWGYNALGSALLLTIVTIAILSMPTPVRVLTEGPANTLVATAPFAWLPLVLVQAAAMGHLLSFRKLRLERGPMP